MSAILKHREEQELALQRAYDLCTDYESLRIALEQTPVFGLIDYKQYDTFTMRDVVMIRKTVEGEYRANVRGTGYIEEKWEEFVEQAKKYNLCFIQPVLMCIPCEREVFE